MVSTKPLGKLKMDLNERKKEMTKIATITAAFWLLAFGQSARSQCTMPPCPSHIVAGQSPDGGTATQLFTAASLVGQS